MQKKPKNKTKPVLWSLESQKNLERIFNHIAENFSVELAVEKTDSILQEVETLGAFPRKGKISIHFNEMRELIVDSNTIYYRNNESDIVIASIRPPGTRSKK